MIQLLATAIVIQGNTNGVWSPSHPHLFPPLVASPQTVHPSFPQEEERYIPETPLTDGNGNPIIF